jgi:hypothetical protein
MTGAADHGGEAHRRRHVRRGQAGRGIGPVLGQVKPAIDEGMALVGDIGREDPDLAVRDLPCRAGVLPPDPAGRGALLEKAGLVDHQHGIRRRQGLESIIADQIAQRVGVPTAAAEHGLLPPRAGIPSRFGAHPAGLAPFRPEQPVQERRGGGRHAGMTEQRPEPRLGRAKFDRPEIQRLFNRCPRHRQSPPSWKGSDRTAEAQL